MAGATSGIRTGSARMLCVLAVAVVAITIHLARGGHVPVPAGQLREEENLRTAAAAEPDDVDLVRRPAPEPEHAATGLLLWSDGVEPVVGCAYGRISDPSEPVQSRQALGKMQVLGNTGSDGAWTLKVGPEEGLSWVVFRLRAHSSVAYRLSAQAVARGGLVLRLPDMGVCEVGIGDPHAAADMEEWDCVVEPWDPSFPGKLVTAEHRSWTSSTEHGLRVVQIYPWKQEGLSRDSVVRYLAPVGAELVVYPWSLTHELQPKALRAMVPSVTVVRASKHVDGTWIRYLTGAAGGVPELLMVYCEERKAAQKWRTWRRMPMYSGRLFVPRETIAKHSPMRVEMCAPDGELFCVTLDDMARPGAAPIDLRQGTGTEPVSLEIPEGSVVSSVWYREEGGAVVPVSEAGPDSGSARQYRLGAGRMLVSVPEECERDVWVFCEGGTIVELHGNVRSVRAPSDSDPWYCVVPPRALMELRANEALIVGLHAPVVSEGRETWIRVSQRRLTVNDEASAWAVRAPAEVRYRASWKRLAEKHGTWQRVGSGQHEVTGPDAILAVPLKGR